MWKKYPGFDYIEVNEDGRIRRTRKRINQENRTYLLKPTLNPAGYYYIRWKINCKLYQRFIHRMLLETFVGPCPKGQITRHLDNNPGNNDLKNICWGTDRENWEDSVKSGTNKAGRVKLDLFDVKQIRSLLYLGWRIVDIAKRYRVSDTAIRDIKTGRTWVGF